ncbi:MAG: S41 family peptidase, partial [Candidatus Omnitrophica bacterium]|nr:S41 family peptidase [Candidatus Omnitrophota bacterium]
GLLVVLMIFAGASYAVTANQQKKDSIYKQVQLFSDAVAITRSDYVDETDSKDLIYGALKGMLNALDPYSQFMDPNDYNELVVETEGKFGGIGIEITMKDGLITVVTPIEDTPAWKAGLKVNDKIVKINNEITRDMTLGDAVKKLRGKPGEAVTMTILRENEKKLLDFKIVRDVIKIRNIKDARILEDKIGYIRLVEFREGANADLEKVLGGLMKQGCASLILDLRNNPGGLLDVAVRVAEKFLGDGKVIVYTKGRKDSQNLQFVSRNKKPILDMPIVVLINEGSASGSEIVAGALQDYKRAIILGTKSFGKASVQTVVPLSDGSAVRLTTSRYFTPSGKLIHDKGIQPDIIVEEAKIELMRKREEVSLDKPDAVFDEVEKQEEKVERKKTDYTSDNQLIRAVDVLKAIKLYQTSSKDKE